MKHNKQNKHEDKISQTANIDAADVTGAHVINYFHRNPNLREISLCSRPNCNEVVATRHGLQIWTQTMNKLYYATRSTYKTFSSIVQIYFQLRNTIT